MPTITAAALRTGSSTAAFQNNMCLMHLIRDLVDNGTNAAVVIGLVDKNELNSTDKDKILTQVMLQQ